MTTTRSRALDNRPNQRDLGSASSAADNPMISLSKSIATVFRFEGRRSINKARLTLWAALACFPPVLLGLVRYNVGLPSDEEFFVVPIVLYVLCPGVVSMLGVLLWASPSIASELEGRSWVYPAVRPRGELAVYFGKYLVAVAWTMPAAWFAAAVAARIMAPNNYGEYIAVQWPLIALSCLSYGAIYSLVGVLIPKRAMVACVFYTITSEVILSTVPAAVNILTIQYRLRCLFVRWMDWDDSLAQNNPVFLTYFGETSSTWHLGVLLGYTVGILILGAIVLSWKEFTSEAEGDV